jgi:hypothetical protein
MKNTERAETLTRIANTLRNHPELNPGDVLLERAGDPCDGDHPNPDLVYVTLPTNWAGEITISRDGKVRIETFNLTPHFSREQITLNYADDARGALVIFERHLYRTLGASRWAPRP